MNNYTIRLKALDGYRALIPEFFGSERFTRAICVPHTGRKGNNPHYHFLITTDYKIPALRIAMKRVFTLGKGNGHISIKDWDGEIRMMAYMFKEDTLEIFNKGFPQEYLDDAKQLCVSVKSDILKNAPSTIVRDATEFFYGNRKDPRNPVSHQEIFMWIMSRLRSNGDWLPNRFQMERWILRIQANIYTDNEFQSLEKMLYETWFGNHGWRPGL